MLTTAAIKGESDIMKTADLMDNFQEELQSCEIQFINYGGRVHFSGPCRTVLCDNDNVLLRRELEKNGDGRVLVVDGGGSMRAALMGDLIAGIALENNWAGIVINGVIRDTVAIGKLDIGVKALGSNPRKSAKKGLGEVDIPLRFGSVTIHPGDWLYSDEDGIIIGPRNLRHEY